eukprot:7547939-Pyramimonas_sp.AAC.1
MAPFLRSHRDDDALNLTRSLGAFTSWCIAMEEQLARNFLSPSSTASDRHQAMRFAFQADFASHPLPSEYGRTSLRFLRASLNASTEGAVTVEPPSILKTLETPSLCALDSACFLNLRISMPAWDLTLKVAYSPGNFNTAQTLQPTPQQPDVGFFPLISHDPGHGLRSDIGSAQRQVDAFLL